MLSPNDIRETKSTPRKLACLTAYDYPTARLLDESGVDLILVGDSVGMVVLGLPDTVEVTMEEMVHHTRAAARGVSRALLVADLPANSYEDVGQTVVNARRLLAAGATAVKLEGGVAVRSQLEALKAAGIPFLGHIGMLPQHVREEGGYKIKGRTEEGLRELMADGHAVEDAGAFGVVVELATREAGRALTEALKIPTIGIGAGPDCDGQILVTHDLIGLFPWFTPKFVHPEARVGESIRTAVGAFIARTRGTAHPANQSP